MTFKTLIGCKIPKWQNIFHVLFDLLNKQIIYMWQTNIYSITWYLHFRVQRSLLFVRQRWRWNHFNLWARHCNASHGREPYWCRSERNDRRGWQRRYDIFLTLTFHWFPFVKRFLWTKKICYIENKAQCAFRIDQRRENGSVVFSRTSNRTVSCWHYVISKPDTLICFRVRAK